MHIIKYGTLVLALLAQAGCLSTSREKFAVAPDFACDEAEQITKQFFDTPVSREEWMKRLRYVSATDREFFFAEFREEDEFSYVGGSCRIYDPSEGKNGLVIIDVRAEQLGGVQFSFVIEQGEIIPNSATVQKHVVVE